MYKNASLISALALAAAAQAGTVEVILSEVGPTSDVGIAGRSITSMSSFSLSANGQWWSVSLGLDGAGSTNNIDLRGQGASWTDVIYQEGVTALPSFPGVTGFFEYNSSTFETSINNNGHVAGTTGNTVSGEPNEFVYTYDGSSLAIIAGEGAEIPAAPGTFYGNFMHSPNMMEDGTVAFFAANTTGGGGVATDEIALFANGTMAGPQKGVTPYVGATLETIDQSGFYVTPDGQHFLFRGDTDDADTNKDDIVVYGTVGTAGTVVLHENGTAIAGGVYDDTFHLSLANNGDWYASGDLTDGTYVALKNGELLAKEGDIAPNGFAYGNIPNIVGNANGDYLWVWDTENPDTAADEILVYNGSHLLLSEGDMIMFDQGAGLAPAIVDEFNAFDIMLSDDGWAYLMVQLDDLNGNNIGDAFIRVAVPAPASMTLLAACGALGLTRRRRK